MCDRLLKPFCAFVVIALVTGCLGMSPSNQPSLDHSLYLENQWNESTTVEIIVVRNATSEIVHNRSYVLDPGEEREVYNTNRTASNGIETFEFQWIAQNQTGQVDITTNSCYGDVYVTVQDDGTAGSSYTIC